MAHPGADYDPYDGIVSNPNKKKNPLVLVGACGLIKATTNDKSKGVSQHDNTIAAAASTSFSHFFSPLLTLIHKTKQNKNTGTVATAGVLVAGLVAFRQVNVLLK